MNKWPHAVLIASGALWLAIMASLGGCQMNQIKTARVALIAVEKSTIAAADTLAAYSKDQQTAIIASARKTGTFATVRDRLSDFRSKREPAVQALKATQDAIEAASLAVDSFEAGIESKDSAIASIQAAVVSLAGLRKALSDIGIASVGGSP